jgi:hypothetical protein
MNVQSSMNRKQLAVLSIVALLVVPTTAMGIVRGSPDLRTSVPDNTLVAGETTQLEITLTNRGDLDTGSTRNPSLNQEVTNARGLEVSLDAGNAPVEVNTATTGLGQLPQGQSATLPFGITVAEDAEPGTYTMELTAEYRHTSTIGESGAGARTENTETRRFDIEIEIDERAQFEVVSTETDARVGSSGTVAVQMRNVGSETARDTSVSLQSQNADVTFGESASASRYVGAWEPGETRTIEYQVGVANTADQQRYAFQATATFADSDGVTRQSEPLSLGVQPMAEQQFRVVDTQSSVAVGDTGTLSVTLENAGEIPVNDATVQLQSQSSDIVFGESASASRYVGAWASGETRTVEYDVTATDGAETRNYALSATVNYDDPQDDPASSRALSLGMQPEPEREFTLSNVESTLRVGEERTLSGTITNEGQTVARDVVVQFTTENQNINPSEREYSVGTLEPGESADFEYTIEVSDAADAGPRQFSFVTEYRNSEGDQRASDTLNTRQEVQPKQDAFDVEVVSGSVTNGQSTQLEVEVTNARDQPVSDVSAKLFADDPISTDDDEAFIESLEPGESETITFGVSASGALPKTYPLSMDFQYDDADGDTLVTDTYRVPVQVQERQQSGGGGLPLSGLAVGGLAVVAIALGGYFRYR